MSSPTRTRRRRQALRNAERCPDCHSDVRIGSGPPPPGVDLQLLVLHDPTCPQLLKRTRTGTTSVLRFVPAATTAGAYR